MEISTWPKRKFYLKMETIITTRHGRTDKQILTNLSEKTVDVKLIERFCAIRSHVSNKLPHPPPTPETYCSKEIDNREKIYFKRDPLSGLYNAAFESRWCLLLITQQNKTNNKTKHQKQQTHQKYYGQSRKRYSNKHWSPKPKEHQTKPILNKAACNAIQNLKDLSLTIND